MVSFLLLNDGTSKVFLNDGTSFVLLNQDGAPAPTEEIYNPKMLLLGVGA